MNPSEEKSTLDVSTPAKAAITPSQIRPDMKVMCSKDAQFGVVDHMQGPTTVKLKKDDKGVHHYMPLSWVTRVDSTIHVDRPGEQAMREWSIEPPKN